MTYVGKLWRGEKSLAFTFWVWYVLIVGWLIGVGGLLGAALAGSVTLFAVWLAVYLSCFVVVVVAVWRSAGHYAGPRIWKWLARIACVLGVLRLVSAPAEIPRLLQTSAGTSGETSLADARDGFRTRLLREDHGGQAAPRPPPDLFRMVVYPSQPGNLAAYISTVPKDGRKHPAIIWVFGGFDNGIDKTAWQPAASGNDQSARAFREAGIITMYPSFRGGNDNPGFREGLYGEVGDIIAAAEFLRHEDAVDPKRIYLGGHSTGGTLVLLVAESTDRFRAVFAFGPVDDVRRYGADDLPFDVSNADESKLRSPIFWLPAIRTPTFVFEGEIQPSNISALSALARAKHSPQIHFYRIPESNHFSVLAKVTPIVAKRIVADTEPNVNIDFGADGQESASRQR